MQIMGFESKSFARPLAAGRRNLIPTNQQPPGTGQK
jgi:hypothetical protein